jgi:hypothetical protein
LLLTTTILIGILTLVMAVHGGVLTSSDPRHRKAFIAYGIVGVLLIFVQGYYLHRDDKEKTAVVDRLQKAVDNLRDQTFALANALRLQVTLDDLHHLEGVITGRLDKLDACCRATKPTVKPPQQTLPPAVVEHIRILQRRAASDDPDAQFGLQVVMQTDVVMQPVAFRVECDQEIKNGKAFIVGEGAYTMFATGWSPDHKAFLFSFHSPALTPDSSLVVSLQSKYDIRVTKVEKIQPLF